MAIKVISGGFLKEGDGAAPNAISPRVGDKAPAPQEQSWPQFIGSQIARPLSRVSEMVEGAPGSLANTLRGLVGQGPLELPEYSPESFAKFLANPEEGLSQAVEFKPVKTMGSVQERNVNYLEPYLGKGTLTAQNLPEQVIDDIFSTLPLALASGGIGALPLAAGRAAAGSVAGQAAEGIGLGPIGGLMGNILGSYGFDLARLRATPGGIRKQATDLYKDHYVKGRDAASGIQVDSRPFSSKLNREWDRISDGKTGLNRSSRKEALYQLNNLEKEIKADRIDLNKIWDSKEHLNKLIKKESDGDLRQFYKEMVGYINENILDEAAKKYPEFGEHYTPYLELYKAVEVPNALRKVFEKSTDIKSIVTNKVAQGVLGGTALFGGPAGLVTAGKTLGTALPAAYAGRYATRAWDLFTKSPTARKLWGNIAQNALEENIPALKTSLIKFNREADKHTQNLPETKQQVSARKNIKVVSGGFLD